MQDFVYRLTLKSHFISDFSPKRQDVALRTQRFYERKRITF